eukprot:2819242-Rhodomonas_salina.2
MLRKSKHCAHALVMVASIAGVIGCGMSPGEVAATLRPISWPERSSGWSTSNVHSVMQLRGGEGSGESLNVDVGTANCTPRDLEVDPATLAAQREARKLAKAKEKEAKKAAKQVKAEETSGEPPIVSFEEAGQPLPMFGDLQIVQSRTNSGRTFQSLHSLQAAETSWVRCHVQQIRAKSNAVFMVLRHCGQTAQGVLFKGGSITKDMIKFASGLPRESVVEIQVISTPACSCALGFNKVPRSRAWSKTPTSLRARFPTSRFAAAHADGLGRPRAPVLIFWFQLSVQRLYCVSRAAA